MFHVLDLNCWFTEKLYFLRLNGIPNSKYVKLNSAYSIEPTRREPG